MPVTDPIADMLTRIRNAGAASHDTVEMPSSRIKVEIARVLVQEGYIQKYELTNTEKPSPTLKITLKYGQRRQPAISGIERVSKPGRRVYVGQDEIPYVRGGMGVTVVTTSHGVLSDRNARDEHVGGEVLLRIW
jgi:small subunit ribosomal protein S8